MEILVPPAPEKETQSGNPEIPDLAKREEERDRKGAVLPVWGGSGAGGALRFGASSASVVARGAGPSAALRSGWRALFAPSAEGAALLSLSGLTAAMLLWYGIGFLGKPVDHSLAMAPAFSEALKDSPAPIGDMGASSIEYLKAANPREDDKSLDGVAPEAAQPAAEPAKPAEPEIPQVSLPEAAKTAAEKKPWPQVAQLFKSDFGKASDKGFLSGGQMGAAGALELKKPGDGFFREGASAAKGTLSGKLGARRMSPAGSRNATRGSADRAMGQLKLAQRLSGQAAYADRAGSARTYGADAFDQQQTLGKTAGFTTSLDSIPSTGLSGGAPMTDMKSISNPMNVTPYQNQVDKAKKESKDSKVLMIIGAILLALGGIMMLIGKKLAADPFTAPQGKALMIVGLLMMIAGGVLLAVGAAKGNSAKKRGDDVAERSGQKDQGAQLNHCADQAMNKQDCESREVRQLRGDQSTVREAVARERNASYSLGGSSLADPNSAGRPL